MPKFRSGKIKQEHHIVPKILPLLRRMERCPEIEAIIPGEISPKTGRTTELTYQYPTDSGFKLLAKSPSAVQEVFVVTPDPAGARRCLEEEGLLPPEREAALPELPPPRKQKRPISLTLQEDRVCPECGGLMRAGTRVVRLPGGKGRLVHTHCARRLRGEK